MTTHKLITGRMTEFTQKLNTCFSAIIRRHGIVFAVVMFTACFVGGELCAQSSPATGYKIKILKPGMNELVEIKGDFNDKDDRLVINRKEAKIILERKRRNGKSEYHASIRPEPGFGVYSAAFPVLSFPSGGTLYIPDRLGRKITFGKGAPQDGITHRGRYPAQYQNMQFLLYSQGRKQYLLWTADAGFYLKNFNAYTSGKQLVLEAVHYPGDIDAKSGYSIPYPVILNEHNGAFKDALKIYKGWTDANIGKNLADNSPGLPGKTAMYFTESRDPHCSLIYKYFTDGAQKQKAIELINDMTQKRIEEIRKLKSENSPNRPIAIFLKDWGRYSNDLATLPEYYPPFSGTGLRMYMNLVRDGITVIPCFYLSRITVTHAAYRYFGKYVKRNYDGGYFDLFMPQEEFPRYRGRPPHYIGGDTRLYQNELRRNWRKPEAKKLIGVLDTIPMDAGRRQEMKKLLRDNWGKDESVISQIRFDRHFREPCWNTPSWKDFCFSLISRTVNEYHAKAVLLEDVPGNCDPCFDPSHRHPRGFGNREIKSIHAFLAELREKYPSLVIISGSISEATVGYVNVFLCENSDIPEAFPLFKSVYDRIPIIEPRQFPALPPQKNKNK